VTEVTIRRTRSSLVSLLILDLKYLRY